MANRERYKENMPELNPEIQELISGMHIRWERSKEEIWSQMIEKIEDGYSETGKTKVITLYVVKYVAAAVLILLLGLPMVMLSYTKKYENNSKQYTEINLPDNSTVQLYNQSKLSYKPLLWKFSRIVRFEGEGTFAVEKGEKFEVRSEKGYTVVLGTRFNIYSKEDEYNVTCFNGKVKVIELSFENEVIVTEGQKAFLQTNGQFVIKNIPDEPSDLINIYPKTDGIEYTKSPTIPISNEKTSDISDIPSTNDNVYSREEKIIEHEKVIEPEAQIKEEVISSDQLKEANPEKNQKNELIENINVGNKADVQQEQVQNQNKEQNKNRERFKASLSSEQIKIMENENISREERRKQFMESLSPEQKEMLMEENSKEQQLEEDKNIQQGKGEDIRTEQKVQQRQTMKQSERKENIRQQKQQNQENKEPGNRKDNKD